MTQPVNVDSAVLRKEAANFERISEALKDQVARVQQTATELVAEHNWKGSARDAVNGALNRYIEAAQAMSYGLNDNSTKLATAGLLYESTDEQQSARLAHAMGFGDETDDSRRGHVNAADNKHHDGDVRLVDNTTTDTPGLPRHDPPIGRWNGPPPPGWHEGTGYWAVDTDHPMNGPNGAPNPSLYQSNPPCVDPRTLTGPPTGLNSVVGDGGSDNPAKQRATGFDMQGTSKVRIVGTEFNGTTQMVQVDGHWYQAQWQEYQYQVNTIPVMNGLGRFGGITLPEMSQANAWQPVSLGELMQKSATYPEATFYLPNPLQGGNIELQNGWWKGGIPSTGIPTPPIMTRGN